MQFQKQQISFGRLQGYKLNIMHAYISMQEYYYCKNSQSKKFIPCQ